MRSSAIPFQFDITDVLKRMRRLGRNRLGDVTLNLPFISIGVSPKDREKQVAREIIIRLRDRRVLSASECCDDCIDRALASLQEIRRLLVDKQVDLSDVEDGPLFLLIEAMTVSIRQFLTFEQRLQAMEQLPANKLRSDVQRPANVRQAYFNGLEILRGHLSRCVGQVAVVAGMNLPTDSLVAGYQDAWQIDAYRPLELTDRSRDS